MQHVTYTNFFESCTSVPPQFALKSEKHKKHSCSCHALGKARVLLLMSNTNWEPSRSTMTSFKNIKKLPLRWCWCGKRPRERTLRVDPELECRSPSFSHLGSVSLFVSPFLSTIRDCVTASRLYWLRHVIFYARAAYPGWSRGSWLGGALVSAQSCVASSHVFRYGACFALFYFVLCSLAPYNNSTMMHKTSFSTELALFTMPILRFGCFCLVFVLLVFASLCGWFFLLFGFSNMALWQPKGLCSWSSASLMIGFTNAPWWLLNTTQSSPVIRALHTRCDRPGESQEAMDGKKILRAVVLDASVKKSKQNCLRPSCPQLKR